MNKKKAQGGERAVGGTADPSLSDSRRARDTPVKCVPVKTRGGGGVRQVWGQDGPRTVSEAVSGQGGIQVPPPLNPHPPPRRGAGCFQAARVPEGNSVGDFSGGAGPVSNHPTSSLSCPPPNSAEGGGLVQGSGPLPGAEGLGGGAEGSAAGRPGDRCRRREARGRSGGEVSSFAYNSGDWGIVPPIM